MKNLGLILSVFFGMLFILPLDAQDDAEVSHKKVFLTILARNKAHMLPFYLKCLDKLDYDKKDIIVYINTNNNEDSTQEVLLEWMKKNAQKYGKMIFENGEFQLDATLPHQWNAQRLSVLAAIRDKSLRLAKSEKADYYFVVDCDNFIIPSTLKDLIAKDKPYIGPVLKAIPDPGDNASNFFAAVDDNGYYRDDPSYMKVLHGETRGTWKMPVVHCTYLIKAEHLDKLSYSTPSGEWEFIVFSRRARENGIDQYVCNEKDYGTSINFREAMTLEAEQKKVKEMPLSQFMLSPSDFEEK